MRRLMEVAQLEKPKGGYTLMGGVAQAIFKKKETWRKTKAAATSGPKPIHNSIASAPPDVWAHGGCWTPIQAAAKPPAPWKSEP